MAAVGGGGGGEVGGGVTTGTLAVTDLLTVVVEPALSATVSDAVYVPEAAYVCVTDAPAPEVPSPNVHAYDAIVSPDAADATASNLYVSDAVPVAVMLAVGAAAGGGGGVVGGFVPVVGYR